MNGKFKDARAELVADAQSEKSMKPTKGSFNNPTQAADPFGRPDTIPIRGAMPRRRSQARGRVLAQHIVSLRACELSLSSL